jgi:hypothetical protein
VDQSPTEPPITDRTPATAETIEAETPAETADESTPADTAATPAPGAGADPIPDPAPVFAEGVEFTPLEPTAEDLAAYEGVDEALATAEIGVTDQPTTEAIDLALGLVPPAVQPVGDATIVTDTPLTLDTSGAADAGGTDEAPPIGEAAPAGETASASETAPSGEILVGSVGTQPVPPSVTDPTIQPATGVTDAAAVEALLAGRELGFTEGVELTPFEPTAQDLAAFESADEALATAEIGITDQPTTEAIDLALGLTPADQPVDDATIVTATPLTPDTSLTSDGGDAADTGGASTEGVDPDGTTSASGTPGVLVASDLVDGSVSDSGSLLGTDLEALRAEQELVLGSGATGGPVSDTSPVGTTPPATTDTRDPLLSTAATAALPSEQLVAEAPDDLDLPLVPDAEGTPAPGGTPTAGTPTTGFAGATLQPFDPSTIDPQVLQLIEAVDSGEATFGTSSPSETAQLDAALFGTGPLGTGPLGTATIPASGDQPVFGTTDAATTRALDGALSSGRTGGGDEPAFGLTDLTTTRSLEQALGDPTVVTRPDTDRPLTPPVVPGASQVTGAGTTRAAGELVAADPTPPVGVAQRTEVPATPGVGRVPGPGGTPSTPSAMTSGQNRPTPGTDEGIPATQQVPGQPAREQLGPPAPTAEQLSQGSGPLGGFLRLDPDFDPLDPQAWTPTPATGVYTVLGTGASSLVNTATLQTRDGLTFGDAFQRQLPGQPLSVFRDLALLGVNNQTIFEDPVANVIAKGTIGSVAGIGSQELARRVLNPAVNTVVENRGADRISRYLDTGDERLLRGDFSTNPDIRLDAPLNNRTIAGINFAVPAANLAIDSGLEFASENIPGLEGIDENYWANLAGDAAALCAGVAGPISVALRKPVWPACYYPAGQVAAATLLTNPPEGVDLGPVGRAVRDVCSDGNPALDVIKQLVCNLGENSGTGPPPAAPPVAVPVPTAPFTPGTAPVVATTGDAATRTGTPAVSPTTAPTGSASESYASPALRPDSRYPLCGTGVADGCIDPTSLRDEDRDGVADNAGSLRDALVGPATVGPRIVGEGIVGPRIVGPRIVGESIVGPRIVGPRIVGEGIVGPRIVGPRIVGEGIVGPRIVGEGRVGRGPVGEAVNFLDQNVVQPVGEAARRYQDWSEEQMRTTVSGSQPLNGVLGFGVSQHRVWFMNGGRGVYDSEGRLQTVEEGNPPSQVDSRSLFVRGLGGSMAVPGRAGSAPSSPPLRPVFR